MYYDATKECFSGGTGWQYAVAIGFAGMCALPVVLFIALFPRGSSDVNTAPPPALSVITKPYRPKFCYWAAVLMAHRLAAVLVGNFLIQQPLARLLVLVLLHITFLLLHVRVQPFRRTELNVAQTILMAFVTMLPISQLPVAAFSTASVRL